MSLRIALACVLLLCLASIIAWPLLPADEPPPLDPSAWVDPPIETPEPPIVEPGVPIQPPIMPATPTTTHKENVDEPVGVAGNSCPNGVCPQPQAGTYRRILRGRFR